MIEAEEKRQNEDHRQKDGKGNIFILEFHSRPERPTNIPQSRFPFNGLVPDFPGSRTLTFRLFFFKYRQWRRRSYFADFFGRERKI
jgi:hypothetical protein